MAVILPGIQGIALWGNMLAQSGKKSSQPWTAPLGMELSLPEMFKSQEMFKQRQNDHP